MIICENSRKFRLYRPIVTPYESAPCEPPVRIQTNQTKEYNHKLMKKIALSLFACLAFAGSVLAGHEVSYKDSKKTVIPPEPCFKDTELQLDVFASYTANQGGGYSDGFGGGIAVNYFFHRMIGIGVDGNVYDGDVNGVWDTTARLIIRFPIEGSVCLAPYIFGGGGAQTNGELTGSLHLGGGLEWRATHTFGVFGEGRYTWVEGDSDNDAAQARLGIRFVF